MDGARDQSVAQPRYVVKDVEDALDSPAHLAAVVGAKGKGVHLKTLPVMGLERLDQQKRSRMVMKVIGKIGDANFFTGGKLKLKGKPFPLHKACRASALRPKLRACTLLLGRDRSHR